jgi:thiol-disulfide isomerase/thioredoxin
MNKLLLLKCILFLFAVTVCGKNKVILQGISSDSTLQKITVYMSESVGLPFTEFYAGSKSLEIKKDNGRFHIEMAPDSPQIILIGAFMTFNQPLYVSPGDSVCFTILPDTVKAHRNRYTYVFEGGNAACYNYMMKKRYEIAEPAYKNDLTAYRNAVDRWYRQQIELLSDFLAGNSLKKDFIQYIKDDTENHAIDLLYRPVMRKPEEKIPANYFDGYAIRENRLSDSYFRVLRYKNIDCFTDNLYDHIEETFNYIRNNFSGDQKAFLLASLTGLLSSKQDLKYETQMEEIAACALACTRDSFSLEYIGRAMDFYKINNRPLPENVLRNTRLLSFTSGRILSLQELLDTHGNRSVYMDFWASWCSPCLNDIRDSDVTKRYLKEKDIVYIYLSLDKDEKAWRNRVKKENISENQYLILHVDTSPILKYLSVTSIPRYLLMDTGHKVKESKAPRPTGEEFESLKRSVEKGSSITY